MSGQLVQPAALTSDWLYDWLKRLLIPSLRNSQHVYAEHLHRRSAVARAWLDIGCGHDVVPQWLGVAANGLSPLAGVDLDAVALRSNSRVRFAIVGNGESLPFADRSFDLVTANMVLEHVAVPDRLFREVARVLQPGGVFLVHTPNRSGYTTLLTRAIPQRLRASLAGTLHDRRAEDVYPTHYRANSAPVLRRLADRCGFEIPTLDYVLSSPQLIRVAPLLVPEMVLIAALQAQALAGMRPCLLATFRRREVHA